VKPRKVAGPSVEQLLILVDRAERGRLSAGEAARLRLGLNALAAARPSSVADQRERAETDRLLRERDAAVRLLADVYGMTVAQAAADVRAAVAESPNVASAA
jgi:hypothetical protein